MEIGSITSLVVQLPLCSAVSKNSQTPIFEPFGKIQSLTILNEIVEITAHIENLCDDIR